MSPRSEAERQREIIEKRYQLLRSKCVPLNGYIEDTLPYPGRGGEVVFRKALALKREWSSEHWRQKLTERSQVDRENCQVVVIPPRDKNNKNKDFVETFYKDLKGNQLGKYPIAHLERQPYHDDPGDIGRKVIGRKKVKTVFIVSSVVDNDDIEDIQHVASQYKLYGEDVQINLVSPFIKSERDDKSVEHMKKGSRKEHTGKIVSILSTMQALYPFIDNIFTFETHSSATQAFAAMFGIDLIPFSSYEELIEPIKDKIIDPKDWRIVRPDVGRTMIARRLSDILKMKGVSLSKFRKGDTLESIDKPLTDVEVRLLKDKNALLYDDEGATLGTVKDITLNHLLKAGVKSINILLGHARLQKGWDKNLDIMINECIKKGIPLKIYITDSRTPIGDLHSFMTKYPGIVELVTVANKVRSIIEASVKGVDFFHDNNWGGIDWERLVLQAIPGYDFKNNK